MILYFFNMLILKKYKKYYFNIFLNMITSLDNHHNPSLFEILESSIF